MGEASKKNTVILNGVSPRAQARAKRSEGSLTETRAEAARVIAPVHSRRLRPFLSAVLHSAFVAKPPKAAFRMTAGFLGLAALAVSASAQVPDKVNYTDHVLPIFRNSCLN